MAKSGLMIAPHVFFSERGTPFSVYLRLKYLASSQNHIDVVTYHLGEDPRLENVSVLRIPNIWFIKKVGVGPSIKKLLVLDQLVFVKALFQLLKKRYDYIYTHEEAAVFGAFVRMLFGIRHIYDMHSSIPLQAEERGFIRSKPVLKALAWIEGWILRHTDLVVTHCQNLKDIVKKNDSKKPVILIENYPHTESSTKPDSKDKAMLRKELGSVGKKVVLYTGSFVKQQNIELLLNSVPHIIKKFSSVKFVLVGGDETDILRLKELKSFKAHKQSILLLPKVPPSQIPLYMSISDVLASPRLTGINVPFKLFSYMDSGKPIIAPKSRLYNTYLDDSNSVLVEPEPKEYAEGVVRLLKNRDLSKRLGKSAKDKVRRDYNVHNYCAKIKEIEDYIGNGQR